MRDPRPISDRWLLVHRLHCEQGLTYAAIGRRLGVTLERARQLDRKAEHAMSLIAVFERVAAARAQRDRELGALSVRTRKCLERSGVRTRAQIASMDDAHLLRLRNFGAGMLAEVRSVVRERAPS